MRSDNLYISQIAALEPTLHFIDKAGINKQQTFKNLQLDLFSIENRQSYLPTQLVHKALLNLKYDDGVDQPGLEVGKHYNFSNWLYINELMSAKTPLEIINHSNYINSNILTNYYGNRLEFIDDKPVITTHVTHTNEASTEYIKASITIYAKVIASMFSDENLIDTISFPFDYCKATESYLSVYAPREIIFNASNVAISLKPNTLLKPINIDHLKTVFGHCQTDLNSINDCMPSPIKQIDDQTYKLIDSMLLQQVPDLNNLCEMSGIHLRTLQRRLKSIGCNFSSMVDRVRHQKAETLLFDPDIKVTDIAYELGYNDSAHFSRAFKRWTGISPKNFRQQAICTEH